MELQILIDKLNFEKCPVHNQSPNLEIVNDKVYYEDKMCCDTFKDYCVNKITDYYIDKTGDDMSKKIIDIFDF
jgi:hypothetical protein